MPPPLPRRSGWVYCFAHSPSRISLPRKGCRVGLRIVRFEDCSAFTHVAACTLARSPIRDPLSEGFSHFVTSMAAPVASGWSGCRVGLAPTGKRRLSTAHTQNGHQPAFHVAVAKRISAPIKAGRLSRYDASSEARAAGVFPITVNPRNCNSSRGDGEKLWKIKQ